MSILIAVAGGSGAGKSTLCTKLIDAYPDKIGLVQLDDYFKPAAEVPYIRGYEVWDHPDSLFLNRLASDLEQLKNGNAVMINTKNLRLNPSYAQTEKRIKVLFEPKPIMLVEGYLVLYLKAIRDLLETSIWLEAPHDMRWDRRVHFRNSGYEKDILMPMLLMCHIWIRIEYIQKRSRSYCHISPGDI
jgi:uridine kinase